MAFSSRGELRGTASHSHRSIMAVLPAYLRDGTKADTKSEADSMGGGALVEQRDDRLDGGHQDFMQTLAY
jgi:hypothetical protein